MILREGEYIMLEYWLKDATPDLITLLNANGFYENLDPQTFYILEQDKERFYALIYPHRPTLLQRFIQRDIPLEDRQNQFLDLINALKKAGVQGIETWIDKVKQYM